MQILNRLKTAIKDNFRVKLLILFFVCIIIPSLLLSIIFYRQANKYVTEMLDTQLNNDIHILENALITDIEHINHISNLIYMNHDVMEVLSMPIKVNERAKVNKLRGRYPVDSIGELMLINQVIDNFSSETIQPHIYLYNRGLYGFYDFTNQVKDLATLQAFDWYYDLPRTSDYQILQIPKSQDNVPSGLCYIRRLYGLRSRELHFAGVMIIPIDTTPLIEMLHNFKPTPHSEITYSNESKEILFSTLSKNTDHNMMANGNINKLTIERYSQDLKGYILVEIPYKELYSHVDLLKNIIIFLVLITVILGMIISKFLSDSLTKPINTLVQAMANTDLNTLEKTIDYSRNDEFGYLINSYNSMTQRLQSLIKQLKESELNALQSRINPHFLYNTLDSINWLSVSRYGAEDISEMITNLSDFFRYGLSNGQSIITIKDEVQHVKHYLKIQKYRYGDRFEYSIDLPDHLENYLIIKITMQPLIENALRHGFQGIDYQGTIHIEVEEKENTIHIHIKDNGIGIDASSMNNLLANSHESKSSYGLRNVNQRLEYYFGSCYGIEFIPSNKGTHAIIYIPKIKNHKEFTHDKDDNC